VVYNPGVSGSGELYAIDASTGALKWNDTIGGEVGSSPAVYNNTVYVGNYDNNLYALNATTGTKLWNYTTGGLVDSSPAAANGAVYVGSYDGNLYAIDASTGALKWNDTIGGEVASSPAVANGVVYVGSYNDAFYAIGNQSVIRPTTLTLSAPSTASINQNFTINGMLNATAGTPVAGAIIQLQKNVSGTWTNVMTNVTDSTGGYQFSQNESANGTYYYRTAYDGNDTYANATSNTVNVTVFSVSRLPTTLSATISSKFVAVNKQFSINGTLSAGTTSLAGATITLQRSTNNATWNNVTNTTTNAAGQYQFSRSESTAHTYYYRTSYDGNATNANATSNVVSVKVVSKASILADLNALSLTVLGTPSSAFIPGTKIATLAVIGATKVNFMVGSYGGATTELKSALLPRMDGCAKTGKPDSDDWVRTCAAQGQLYPQVQNLIQELQALQGS
jgi:5-hydroxyisourate hydrolase-like protein (transthyretin family)